MAMITTALLPAEAFEATVSQLEAAGGDLPISREALLRLMRLVPIVFAPIMTIVMILIIGGVSALIFAGILGDEGRFKQHLALAAHSSLIVGLGGFFSLALIILAGDLMAGLTLANFFRPFMDEGYPLRVLQQLSPIGLWALAVLAIGVSRLDPERGWLSAVIWLLVLRVMLALLLGLIPTQPGMGG